MPNDAMKQRVATIIREARESHSWTRRDADRRIGCAGGMTANWENARHLPQLQLWPHVVTALGISQERERWALYGDDQERAHRVAEVAA